MKELTDRMQLMVVEANELGEQIDSFKTGIREQVSSILSHPPPRSLYSKNTSPGQTRHTGLGGTGAAAGSNGKKHAPTEEPMK